jgi:hypothetical protein
LEKRCKITAIFFTVQIFCDFFLCVGFL